MAEPLHELIYQDIKKKIMEHIYTEGSLLPTELEMESIYNASRAPVRQALSRLSKDGYIFRRAGKGTFVAGRLNWPFPQLGGHAQEFAKKGKYLHCETISIIEKHPSIALARVMGISPDENILNVKRVRYYKDKPIHYLCHYILGVDKDFLIKEGNFSSLHAIYVQLGIDIGSTEDELEAMAATSEMANILNIAEGTPILCINRKTFKKDGTLLEFMHYYINSKEWKYRTKYVLD